jgi:hypothetical protein
MHRSWQGAAVCLWLAGSRAERERWRPQGVGRHRHTVSALRPPTCEGFRLST